MKLDFDKVTLNNCKNNTIFTIVNKGYIDIARNFIQRLKELNMFQGMLFICTDKASYEYFSNDTYIQVLQQNTESIVQEFVEWKDKEYHDLVFNKFDITKQVLDKAKELNIDRVLYLDTDIWFFKNFEEDLFNLVNEKYFYSDIILQDGENYRLCPEPIEQTYENGVFKKNRASVRYCTGFMIMKPSDKTSRLFDYKNNQNVDFNKFVGNQPFLNKVIQFEPDVNVLNLDRALGVNGSLFNDEKAVERLTEDESKKAVEAISSSAWFLHYTYCKGTDKLLKMKSHNHWII